MISKENAKEIEYILRCSNASERDFVFSGEAEESLDTKFDYFPESVQLKRLASGELGMISDAYILYMLTLFGNATAETVNNMLQAYSNNHKELRIVYETRGNIGSNSESVIVSRIKFMVKSGFLFRKKYDIGRPDGRFDGIVLYGTNKDTQTFMNRKLHKKVVIRPWSVATPLNEAIAEAAASYVASVVALKGGCNLAALKEDAIKTTEMGTIIPPPCLFLDSTSSEEKYQVMFCPAFLNQSETYQTDNDFERTLKYKVDIIRNYLYVYTKSGIAPKKRPGYCVVVCESRQDMENMKIVIQQTKSLIKTDSLPYIYFTSEGAVRVTSSLKDAFLKLNCTEEGELYFTKETPPFIKTR